MRQATIMLMLMLVEGCCMQSLSSMAALFPERVLVCAWQACCMVAGWLLDVIWAGMPGFLYFVFFSLYACWIQLGSSKAVLQMVAWFPRRPQQHNAHLNSDAHIFASACL